MVLKHTYYFRPCFSAVTYYYSVPVHVVEFGNMGVEGVSLGALLNQWSCPSLNQKTKVLDLCTSVSVMGGGNM